MPELVKLGAVLAFLLLMLAHMILMIKRKRIADLQHGNALGHSLLTNNEYARMKRSARAAIETPGDRRFNHFLFAVITAPCLAIAMYCVYDTYAIASNHGLSLSAVMRDFYQGERAFSRVEIDIARSIYVASFGLWASIAMVLVWSFAIDQDSHTQFLGRAYLRLKQLNDPNIPQDEALSDKK